MPIPLLIGLIWLGLLVLVTGVVRVGTSTPTPLPGVVPPVAVSDRASAATAQRTRPEQFARAAIAARVDAA